MKKALIVALSFVLAASMATAFQGPKSTRIEGQIAAIDAANLQIVVNGVTVQVTTNTLIRMKDVPITFDDLKVGMTVVVCGLMDGDVLKAHAITVKYLGK
jgi:FlaG/FlaF family flagellin (archaellin)